MQFSVIVPFLNEERYIEHCVVALRTQTVPRANYELIFVDNGSRDASAGIVRSYPDIIMVEQIRVPRNVYATRNRGLQLATGEIMAFTDADCKPAPDWLAQIGAAMLRTGAGLLLGRRRFVPAASRALRMFEDYENAKAKYVVVARDARFRFGFGNNMAVRRSIFEALGPFAELPLSGDTELVQRCTEQLAGARVAYVEEMVVEHLEVTSVIQWMQKLRMYGTHNRQVKGMRRGYEELRMGAKIEIARQCALVNGYGPLRTAAFLCLLAIGNLFYAYGRHSTQRPSRGSAG
jgi:glycosyltransferase involved in cell wall biosynthesis